MPYITLVLLKLDHLLPLDYLMDPFVQVKTLPILGQGIMNF